MRCTGTWDMGNRGSEGRRGTCTGADSGGPNTASAAGQGQSSMFNSSLPTHLVPDGAHHALLAMPAAELVSQLGPPRVAHQHLDDAGVLVIAG